MNQQELNNLKIGDKVVVARVVNPLTQRYQGMMNPVDYLGKQGIVEDLYKDSIKVLFEGRTSWYFNIEDIDLITEKEPVMQETKKPHFHAELIKAWADGEEIEYWSNSRNEWYSCTRNQTWDVETTYRIKPKFQKRYKYAYFSVTHNCWCLSEDYYSSDKAFKQNGHELFEKIEASEKEFQIN